MTWTSPTRTASLTRFSTRRPARSSWRSRTSSTCSADRQCGRWRGWDRVRPGQRPHSRGGSRITNDPEYLTRGATHVRCALLGSRLCLPPSRGPGDRRRAARRAGAAARRPAADRQRELHLARGPGRTRQHAVEQVRRGLSRPALLRRLRRGRQGRADRASTAPSSCSAPSTPTSSRTPAPARTSPPTPPSCRPATRCSRCRCRTAATSRTARRSTSPARWFSTVSYGVREDDELIDYDQVRVLALEHQPKMIICGATAYPRLIDFAAFRSIADEVGAILMVDAAHFIGLVAGGAIPSPVPYADVVCFTTHKVLRGPRGGMIVCREEHADEDRQGGVPVPPGRSADARRRREGSRAEGVPAAGATSRTRVRSSRTPRRWRTGWPPRGCGRSAAARTPISR